VTQQFYKQDMIGSISQVAQVFALSRSDQTMFYDRTLLVTAANLFLSASQKMRVTRTVPGMILVVRSLLSKRKVFRQHKSKKYFTPS
jgi:hypothetical protein